MGDNSGTEGKERQKRRKMRKDPSHLAFVIQDSEAEARRLENRLSELSPSEQFKIESRISSLRSQVIPNHVKRLARLNRDPSERFAMYASAINGGNK